jgi:hypothetical protein
MLDIINKESKSLIMKVYLTILIILSVCLITMTCDNGDGPEPENPTCTDGEQNGDETGIDCGGSCVECFDCFSDYCVYLSGSTPPGEVTLKKWKCTELDGVSIEEIENCEQDLGCKIIEAVRLEIQSKGKATLTGLDGKESGKWSFDDPENPTLLIIIYDNPEGVYGEQELIGLESVSENEFVADWFGKTAKFEPY